MMKLDELTFKLCVAGVAAVALFTGTTSFAQQQARPNVRDQSSVRMISDPADIAALLAKCGIKRDASGRIVAPQSERKEGAVQMQVVRCDAARDWKPTPK
jgi:hypothetical protein